MSQKDAVQPRDGPTRSSLDIFLFSNGQQYSPPRKYNLRADELTWWDTTLSFLARSQYGTEHTSIQLYTIEGKQVVGPLELSHGDAYVAVAPPEAFVQTGYRAYMMKASRSWEKRHQKRNSENIQPQPDKPMIITKFARSEEDNKANGLKKVVKDIFIVPTTATVTALPATATVTSSSASKAKQIPKSVSRNAPSKQKPKTTLPQQRLSILRNRNSKPESLPSRKQTPIAQVDAAKKCAGKNLEKEAVLIKSESLLFGQLAKPNFDGSEKPQTVAESEKRENGEPSSIIIQAKSTSACDIILRNTVIEGVDGKVDRDILSSLMNREDQNYCECPNTDTNPIVHYDKDKLPVPLNDVELKVIVNSSNNDTCVNSDLLSTKIEMHSKVESKVNIIDKPVNSQDNSVVTGSQTAENFLVFVSKGDVINLKLNIEVNNNGASSMNKPNICREMKPHLVVDDTKSEYEREPAARPIVNNISLAGSVAPALTKSWQSITVCQCSHGSNPDQVLSITSIPVYVDDNNYFIVLPSEKGNKNSTSCNCGFETLESEQSHTRPGNNGNELKLSKNISETEELLVQKDFMFNCERKCPLCVVVKNQPAAFDNIQEPAPSETAGSPRPKDFIYDCEMKCPRCAMGHNPQYTFESFQQPVVKETVVLPVQKNFLFDCKKECPGCSTCKDQPVYVNKQRRYSTMYDCICGKLREVNKHRTIKTLLDDSTQTDWNNLLVMLAQFGLHRAVPEHFGSSNTASHPAASWILQLRVIALTITFIHTSTVFRDIFINLR